MLEFIEVKGARENNLNNVSLKIPKRQITIFTGVSGSGKSSIVFDTIAEEAGRQLNENYSAFVRGFLPKYKRPEGDSIENLSRVVAVNQNRIGGNARSTLGTITDINPLLRLLFSRIGLPALGESWHFSFNDPHGMCSVCEGLGNTLTLDLNKAVDFEKSLNEGAITLPGYKVGNWQWKIYAYSGFFDTDKRIKDYSKEELEKFLYGPQEKITYKLESEFLTNYEGLIVRFNKQYLKKDTGKSNHSQNTINAYMIEEKCSECKGTRYNQDVLNCRIGDYNIADLTALQISDLRAVLSTITHDMAKPIIKDLNERLTDLIDIGLDYVSLDRETSTLSGGESQRVKMVKHLSSSLVDTIYIFDEPSIGLHPRDVHRLNNLLIKLRDKGNTIIVVEHDPDVIRIADHIIDVGPHAGSLGGNITFEGTYKDLLKSDTLTGRHIGVDLDFKEDVRKPDTFFTSSKSTLHNLKNVSLNIPEGLFTVVSGVAGSGKSTLVNGVFAKEYPEAVVIDQSAVSTSSRSNLATYTGIMDSIRKLFAEKNEVGVGLFSYNSDGACETCKGHGIIKTDLSFMDPVEIICEECNGLRYKREVYQYKLGGKNISEILSLSIEEAYEFFEDKTIKNKLKNILNVGLGYMTLGQPLNTLSGGECQRIKLAKEFNKNGNIYIMDEPTTGLHISDIKNILEIIENLVNKGNTVVVIEHNLGVMRRADWIIDIGLDGGINGGTIIFEGSPKQLKNSEVSITAQYI